MADRTVRVRLEAAVEGFRSAMRSSSQDTKGFSGAVRENKAELTQLGMAAAAVGVAAAAGIKSVLSTGMQYQASMNQVRAVTGATGAEMEQMSGQARELGASTKFSASEAADAMYFLASAGLSTSEVMSAMPGVLQLAAAGNMDLATTADIASNVLSGYAMDVSDLSRVNDVLAVTFTKTNTNIAQAGEAMKYVAPVAAAAGVQFEEAAAAVGLLGNAGIQGSMAGTTLRGVITALINPTGDAADILGRLGVNALDSSGQMVPLADIIDQLGVSGATTGELMTVFGQRAGPGMAALVSQGADALRDQTQAGLESAGTAADIAAIQMEGLQGALTELGSAWEGLKIAMSESGAGGIAEGAVRGLTSFVQTLESMPPAAHAAVMGTGALVAAVGTLGGGALILLPRIVSTMDAIEKLGGISTITRRSVSGLASFAFHPLTLAVGAAAVAVGGYTQTKQRLQAGAEQWHAILREEVDLVNLAAGAFDNLSEATRREFYEGIMGRHPQLVAMLEEQGLNLHDLTVYLEDMVDPTSAVATALAELWDTPTHGRFAEALNDLARELGYASSNADMLEESLYAGERQARASEAATARLTAQAAYYGVEVSSATGATLAFDDALDGAEGQADDTRTAIERLTDSLDILVGVNITAERAAIRLEEGYVKLRDEIKSGSNAFDINTEKGRANRSMILDQVDAMLQAMEAEYNRTGSMYAVGELYAQHEAQLRAVLRQAGLTEVQVDDYITTLGLTPEDVYTSILSNAGEAITMAERVAQALGRIPTRITTTHEIVQTQRSVPGQVSRLHGGGSAGRGFIPRQPERSAA